MRQFKRYLISACIVAMTILPAAGAIPARYYSTINGKKGAELKTALSNLIYNHTEISSYNDLPQYFKRTDVYPDGLRWWDMYSNKNLYLPSFSGLNREHSFPKSWWGSSTTVPAYIDLNHLYPSEMNANTAKSNYPLGIVGTATFDNGVSKVGYATGGTGGGAAKVFEPADEYKGDFARTYFYMVTCYQNMTWNRNYMWMLQQNTYPTLSKWAYELLLKWNEQDPVSEKERNRNEQVYLIQNNRNPFIDYPQLAEYIWGNKTDVEFYEDNIEEPSGTPLLITPVQDMSLEFNEVAVNNTVTSRLYFNGENLTGRLELVITGDDKALFSIDTKSIESSLVNSTAGYWLTVTYTPTSVGSHTAKLIISEGGIPGSRGVFLTGQGCEVPQLTAFKALPATDITTESYIAHWEEPDYDVDYYIVNRTRYYTGNSVTDQLIAEDNELLIDDFDPSVSESYNVVSVRLGYQSPESNEIYVQYDESGISEVTGDVPLGTAYTPGGIRFVCGTPHTNMVIYDMQGRVAQTIELVENNMEVMLSPGVYVVMTDQCHSPVRVVVR